jgi:hypothetical protein
MPNDSGPPGPPEPPPAAPAERAQYTPAEQQAIREAYAAGAAPACPRDGAAMTARPIGGGSFGLGYARRREWLMCPVCRRSALFDVKRGTRN